MRTGLGRSGTTRRPYGPGRSWSSPLPQQPKAWCGWVDIAQKTGFRPVPLLPIIWSSPHLDTAVTLPVGIECYAAYALRAWLAAGHAISDRTRRLARTAWSPRDLHRRRGPGRSLPGSTSSSARSANRRQPLWTRELMTVIAAAELRDGEYTASSLPG
jgi:hypothetical protein